MECQEIIAAIESVAPLAGAAPWDLSGMQVASTRSDYKKMAVVLDATPEQVGKAIEMGADFLLSHHPLTLKPALPSVPGAWHDVLRQVFCANMAVYAAHTSLDANPLGPAGWLGVELGLGNRAVLEPAANDSPEHVSGFGCVGDLPQAMAAADICRRVLELVGIAEASICGPDPGVIRRLAYCGGSGASLAAAAKTAGACLFVTGDIKYHTALDAEIAILDVGHHALEEEMMKRFAEWLAGVLPDLEVAFLPSLSPFRKIFL